MDARTKFDSDFYKLVNGHNKMRILTEFVKVIAMNEGKQYKGIFTGTDIEERAWVEAGGKSKDGKFIRRTSFKAWAWAIVRSVEGDEIKIVQFGNSVIKQLFALKNDTEYGFTDFPIPYDIDINTTGAGTLEANYTVVPARQNTEVTNDEMAKLNKKKTIEDIVGAILDKQNGKKNDMSGSSAVPYPEEKINPEDIPF